MKNKNKLTALYRMFDEQNNLLYVGISQNWFDRLATHKAEKIWIDETKSITLDWYADTASAAIAERTAIRWENPKYNKQSVVSHTKQWQHFEMLWLPVNLQRDAFHLDVVTRVNKIKNNSHVFSDNWHEWALSNVLWDLSTSDEMLTLECQECVSLGESWWILEGHAAVCDQKREM
jgi:predicted GIY-YIG superfamily endonuclease